MDVVVTGRHCEITDRYRSHVEEKLARLEKHDHRIMRVHVENGRPVVYGSTTFPITRVEFVLDLE